jgi:hypothetical protein
MTRCVKVLGQRAIVIYKTVTDATNILLAVSLSTGGTSTLNKLNTLTSEQRAAWIADGFIQLNLADITIGTLADGWYDLTISVTGGAYAGVDTDAGFGYTPTVTNQLYSRISCINPYAPTFSVSQSFHTAKMLLDEINMLENLEVPHRVYQFDKRILILKEILGYA